MTDIFNLSIPQLRQWSRRQVPDHRQLNEPVEVLNRMATGIAPPRARMGAPVAVAVAAVVSAVAQFRLRSSPTIYPDHLVCRTWDGTTEGEDDIWVAKPWLLRQTPFHAVAARAGVTYRYLSPTTRDARMGTNIERQIIIPVFQIFDIIYASKGIVGGTGVVYNDEPVEWLAHSDGRGWAWVAP